METVLWIGIGVGVAVIVALGWVAHAILKLESTLGRVREMVAREAAVAIVEDVKQELEETYPDPILGG